MEWLGSLIVTYHASPFLSCLFYNFDSAREYFCLCRYHIMTESGCLIMFRFKIVAVLIYEPSRCANRSLFFGCDCVEQQCGSGLWRWSLVCTFLVSKTVRSRSIISTFWWDSLNTYSLVVPHITVRQSKTWLNTLALMQDWEAFFVIPKIYAFWVCKRDCSGW